MQKGFRGGYCEKTQVKCEKTQAKCEKTQVLSTAEKCPRSGILKCANMRSALDLTPHECSHNNVS